MSALIWDQSSSPASTNGTWESAGNTTSAPLGAGASFTGVAERVSGFSSIAITVLADVASAVDGLVSELSNDGVTWQRAKLSTVSAGQAQAHVVCPAERFFRVRYTNGASAQLSFSLVVVYHRVAIQNPRSHSQRTMSAHEDAEIVRVASDFEHDSNFNRVSWARTVSRTGTNDAVGSGSYEDIWRIGGLYPFPSTALPLRVMAGGTASDTAAGAGARSVVIEGLDADWNPATETVATNGAGASAPTSTSFIRVGRVYVGECGTYGGSNDGQVIIATTGGTALSSIEAGLGQSQSGIYSVPAGKRAYITSGSVQTSSNSSKPANIRLFRRETAGIIGAPFGPRRLILEFLEVVGRVDFSRAAYNEVDEKSDVWFSAIGASGATLVTVVVDIIEVDKV